MKQAYLQSDNGTLKQASQELSKLLAFMRAMHWHYWTAHWQVFGDASYGDHLLFQRLYEGMQEEIDTLAEKVVGLFGYEHVAAEPQIDVTHKILGKFDHIDCVHKKGLALERVFQSELKHVYGWFQVHDAMTLGLDDFLMATANAHETNIYLLQQRKAPRATAVSKSKLASLNAELRKLWFAGEVAQQSFRDIWFGKTARGPAPSGGDQSSYGSKPAAKKYFDIYKKDHPDTKKTWKDFYDPSLADKGKGEEKTDEKGKGEAEKPTPEEAAKTVKEEGQVPDRIQEELQALAGELPKELKGQLEEEFNTRSKEWEAGEGANASDVDRVSFYDNLGKELDKKYREKADFSKPAEVDTGGAAGEAPADKRQKLDVGETKSFGQEEFSKPAEVEVDADVMNNLPKDTRKRFDALPDDIKDKTNEMVASEKKSLQESFPDASPEEVDKMMEASAQAMASRLEDEGWQDAVSKADTPAKKEFVGAALAMTPEKAEEVKTSMEAAKKSWLQKKAPRLSGALSWVKGKLKKEFKKAGLIGAPFSIIGQLVGGGASLASKGGDLTARFLFGNNVVDAIDNKVAEFMSQSKVKKAWAKAEKQNKKEAKKARKAYENALKEQLMALSGLGKSLQKTLKKAGMGNLAGPLQEILMSHILATATQGIMAASGAAEKAQPLPASAKPPAQQGGAQETPPQGQSSSNLSKNDRKSEEAIRSLFESAGVQNWKKKLQNYSYSDFKFAEGNAAGGEKISREDWAKAAVDIEKMMEGPGGEKVPTYAVYKKRLRDEGREPLTKQQWDALIEASVHGGGGGAQKKGSYIGGYFWKFAQTEEEPVAEESEDSIDSDMEALFEKITELLTDPDPEFINEVLASFDEEGDESTEETPAEEPEAEEESAPVEEEDEVAQKMANWKFAGAEHYFFDNPEKREVRELAQKKTPPTPSEIKKQPGGSQFSTLNRYVVRTEEDVPRLPEGRKQHPKISTWTFSNT